MSAALQLIYQVGPIVAAVFAMYKLNQVQLAKIKADFARGVADIKAHAGTAAIAEDMRKVAEDVAGIKVSVAASK